jgi:two-component system, OmpR family, sensor histidine kinase KdpD
MVQIIEIGTWHVAEVFQARVFDKFTRGEKASAKPGIGLGLAICRAIVEAQGGKISASNRVDTNGQLLGACFWFMLPADETPPTESEQGALIAEDAVDTPSTTDLGTAEQQA